MQPNSLRSAVALRNFLNNNAVDDMFPEGELGLRELISTVHAYRTLAECNIFSHITVNEGVLSFKDSAILDSDLGLNANWVLHVTPEMRMTFAEFNVGGDYALVESLRDDPRYEAFADLGSNRLSFKSVDCALVADCSRIMTGFADLLASMMFNNTTIAEVEQFLSAINIEVTEEVTINVNGVLYDKIPPGGDVMLKECPEAYDYIKVTAALFAMNQQINSINLVLDTEDTLIAIEPA